MVVAGGGAGVVGVAVEGGAATVVSAAVAGTDVVGTAVVSGVSGVAIAPVVPTSSVVVAVPVSVGAVVSVSLHAVANATEASTASPNLRRWPIAPEGTKRAGPSVRGSGRRAGPRGRP